MSNQSFYVTTPIYYVNDVPHVGHAYTSLLADVFARYHRLLGFDAWMQTGTDEHGLKVQQAADARGVEPQAHCDAMVGHFTELLDLIGTAHDDFIRTTEPRHISVVQRAIQKLFDKGDIYKDVYEGWYHARSERYYTEREVEEIRAGESDEDVHPDELEWLEEPNYFFRMSNYADELQRLVESDEFLITPSKRKNEVLGFIRGGVRDLCISRNKKNLAWGVPLPFDEDFVLYVWFDALLNYESAVGYLGDGPDDAARHAKWWPADVHVIGKDILTTHCVYWPIYLLALEEPLPTCVLAHGWLLDSEGGKLSKTKRAGQGDVRVGRPQPTIGEMVEILGCDPTRWFLATVMKPGDDTAFNWDLVRERLNADLANGLGNSVSRVLKMVAKYADGVVPELGEGTDEDRALAASAEAAVAAVRAFPETLDLPAITSAVRVAVSDLAQYIAREQPWAKAKEEGGLPRVRQVLAWSLETLRLIGLVVTPVMPTKSAALRELLGEPSEIDFEREAVWGGLPAGRAVGSTKGLFPRIEENSLPAAADAAS